MDGDGLYPVQEKIDAIKNAPAPKDVGKLRSFLGMVQCTVLFTFSTRISHYPCTIAPVIEERCTVEVDKCGADSV